MSHRVDGGGTPRVPLALSLARSLAHNRGRGVAEGVHPWCSPGRVSQDVGVPRDPIGPPGRACVSVSERESREPTARVRPLTVKVGQRPQGTGTCCRCLSTPVANAPYGARVPTMGNENVPVDHKIHHGWHPGYTPPSPTLDPFGIPHHRSLRPSSLPRGRNFRSTGT